MGLFDKFGKKTEMVIENFDMRDNLVLRKCLDDVSADVVVQVMANTEAIALVNGAKYSVFKEGRHVIELTKGAKGAKKMSVDVCYVNKTVRLPAFWGTPSKIDFIDADTSIPVSLGVSGQVIFEISNSVKIFERAMGTAGALDVGKMTDFLKTTISTEVKDILARKLTIEQLGFYSLSTEIKAVSKSVMDELKPKFDDYGTAIVEFTIDNLVYPQDIKDLMQQLAKDRYIMKQKDTSFSEARKERKEDKQKVYDLVKTAIEKSSDNDDKDKKQDKDEKTFCSGCGKELDADSQFCPKCGKAQATYKTCPKCDKKLPLDAMFCSGCGESIK